MGILKAVVAHNPRSQGDNNLYMLLVGNRDAGFVFSALDKLIDQSQFIEELEAIMEIVGKYGAPASYAENMRELITRMRSHRRPSSGFSMGVSGPRVATPPLEDEPTPPVPHALGAEPEPSSARPIQFLTPEVPASVARGIGRGRGGRGGRGRGGGETPGSGSAGSKRSVSGNGQGGGRGAKRAR